MPDSPRLTLLGRVRMLGGPKPLTEVVGRFFDGRVIGRCSKCGGDVCVPTVWLGLQPPVPTCSSCGARKARNLPTIEMEGGLPAPAPWPDAVVC